MLRAGLRPELRPRLHPAQRARACGDGDVRIPRSQPDCIPTCEPQSILCCKPSCVPNCGYSAGVKCRCGCGEEARPGRAFVDKRHQVQWLRQGGAREIGALAPLEARRRGGIVGGQKAVESGQLREAGRRGGQRSREIAEEIRRQEPVRAEWGPFRRKEGSASPGGAGGQGGGEGQ